ncbi:uncharacterized protein [Diadema setosum]|uniref:uncharacterized protein n=1 Tax=Diadema setosum TaxID=31175 RepID=UPI003B3BD3D5
MNAITLFSRPILVVLIGLACLGVTVHGLSAVVVEPVNGEAETEAGLIVIPGAQLRGESYLPLAQSIQRASPLKLWVALTTDYFEDTPNPIELSRAIRMATTQLKDRGMAADTPIYMAGHSLGGTFLQTYVKNRPNDARGMMLWGSYLTGSTASLRAFPTPVMHLSGDLDGQVRITRIAKTFRELEEIAADDLAALATKPVITVEGVNHFQFSSGAPPPLVVREDIPADVNASEAWSLLAKVSSDFMSYNLNVETIGSFVSLAWAHAGTKAKIAPLTAVKDIEWDGSMSSWVIDAQMQVAAFPEDNETPVTVYNVGYTNQGEFERSKPSVVKGSDGVAIITTRSKVEFPCNPVDISNIMDSADEIAAKMKNQVAIQKFVPGDTYSNSATCKEINQAAYNYVYQIAPDVVKLRYEKRGRPIVFGDDVITATGSAWVNSHVEYKTQNDNTTLVTSSSLYTDVKFPVTNLAGMYYCKLMSPYRALEWMYVDSLRPIADV